MRQVTHRIAWQSDAQALLARSDIVLLNESLNVFPVLLRQGQKLVIMASVLFFTDVYSMFHKPDLRIVFISMATVLLAVGLYLLRNGD